MADITSQFPNTPSFQTVDFKVITPTITSETTSGKKRRVGQGISYYTWTAKYSPLTPRDAGPIIGFIRYAEGPLYSFEVVLPEISFTKCFSQPTGNVSVRSNIAIGSSNVLITTTNTGTGEVLRAGDYFKFANHSKVYQAVINCNTDANTNATYGTGNTVLTFASPTVSNVPAGTNLTITNVPFTAIIDSAEQDITVGFGGMTELEIQMREVW
jgi:hypothetical protein